MAVRDERYDEEQRLRKFRGKNWISYEFKCNREQERLQRKIRVLERLRNVLIMEMEFEVPFSFFFISSYWLI